jgi:hypothetical protein
MEKPFILNPNLTSINIQDAIDERIEKARGVLNCLIFALQFTQEDQVLDESSTWYALWTIDGFLDEVTCLRQKCTE